ncbi:MAG: protein kinase, partial [Bacteroidota bacterium]|nr:protein kinase [Bacteroidota bacterium]
MAQESGGHFGDLLSSGTVLRNYEIGRVIGRGGFSVVYRGIHREIGATVAIKEYYPSEIAGRQGDTIRPSQTIHKEAFEDGLRRFADEARRLESFRDCPVIVTCRDLFRANGTAYMVMDYVDGRSLSDLLERREANGIPFTERDLLAVVRPLLAGLSVVHKAGVYHRDIKLSNILIRKSDSQPVLIDFGAAKQVTSALTKSFAPYTDGYAAMEQVGEGEIGAWTDIYGLGAVMWRIVAGNAPPWMPPRPTPVQRRALAQMQGMADPLPQAQEIGSGMFTPRLLSTIDECLTISPTSRIASCEALITRLGADISGGTASGQPSQSALEVTGVSVVDSALKQTAPRRRTRRYRWVAPGLLALVVLTAWFMNDFWPFSGRGPDESPSAFDGALTSELGDESPPRSRPTPTSPLVLYDTNRNGVISCDEARAAGIVPVRRGHPAYLFMVDLDNDGIVCESGGHRSTDGQTVRGPQPGTFTRGSHADIVLQVQGTP